MASRTGKVKLSKTKSRSARAGITFPVGRVTRNLRNLCCHSRLGSAAPVYTAAVLEYLTAEVLMLAGDRAKESKKRRIRPRDVKLSIETDTELNKLCQKTTFSEGGVAEQIHKSLLPEKIRNKIKHSSKLSGKVVKSSRKKPLVKVAAKRHKGPADPPSASRSVTASTAPTTSVSTPDTNLPVLSEVTLFLGQRLSVVMGSIADVSAEALVHPTNATYSSSGQVGSLLYQRGGSPYQRALHELAARGNLPICGASICDVGEGSLLKVNKVIHCNSPSWNSSKGISDLEKSVENCLKLADKENLKSVALPSIGSGNAGWPKQLAAETILGTINRYFQTIMASSIRHIYFVLFDKESIDAYTHELARLITNSAS